MVTLIAAALVGQVLWTPYPPYESPLNTAIEAQILYNMTPIPYIPPPQMKTITIARGRMLPNARIKTITVGPGVLVLDLPVGEQTLSLRGLVFRSPGGFHKFAPGDLVRVEGSMVTFIRNEDSLDVEDL